MDYGVVVQAHFLQRMNRFVARVETPRGEEITHVKNTGRLGELLLPGAVVYLKYSDNPARRTASDLIAVEKDGQIVNIDSQATNRVFAEWAAAGHFGGVLREIRPEFVYGDSRFDFRLDRDGVIQFVEIKGVTLLRGESACFPDAPTDRGVKHLRGLIRAVEEGYSAAAFFVVQMKGARELCPNDETQPAFGAALRDAAAVGVEIYAYDCIVTEHTLQIDRPLAISL